MKNNSRKKGRLRQSLGIRISFSYSLFLLRSLIWQILLLSAVYWICALGNASVSARDAAHIYAQGISAEGSAPTDMMLQIDRAQITPLEPEQQRLRFLSFCDRRLVMTIDVPLSDAQVCVQYVLSGESQLYCVLLVTWIILEAFRIGTLMRQGEHISRRALRPITEIAETARRLSASNLSERIELHGARTELRELSDVLNDMLDRIEAAYNTQKQFVSDASHELRTPIAVIQGYADMLERWGKSDPEVRDESIAAIRSEAMGMKELVEQLLFIARHDNRTHQYEKIYFDAGELAEELFKETRLIAKSHRVIHGDLHRAIICGDRASLKQALRIFLDNAVKYTPEGGCITLSCQKEENFCRISVTDTGIGVSKQDLQRIFERFYRSDPARTRRTDGHGLGLSIARIIIRAHGGFIEVQSKEGHGSRFHILLPL